MSWDANENLAGADGPVLYLGALFRCLRTNPQGALKWPIYLMIRDTDPAGRRFWNSPRELIN